MLARGEDDLADRDHTLLANGLSDHREGLLADLTVRHDVVRVVEVELVDLFARHEFVDLDGALALDRYGLDNRARAAPCHRSAQRHLQSGGAGLRRTCRRGLPRDLRAVRLRQRGSAAAHVDATAEVPIIILSGSEGALGEWCFALNNGSMPEEPRMLASVLLGDGHRRIAIAYESSLIGKEYLAYAERAYAEAGLKVVGDRRDSAGGGRQGRRGRRAARSRARRHRARRVRAWAVGLQRCSVAANWDPPRYTTTAFEMAHINEDWMHHLRRLDRAGQLRRTQRGRPGIPRPVRGPLRPSAAATSCHACATTSRR